MLRNSGSSGTGDSSSHPETRRGSAAVQHALTQGRRCNQHVPDALTIQFHGRWASDAFKLYTRLCNESVTTIAERMVSGATSSTTLR
jgi:hypothetical protein